MRVGSRPSVWISGGPENAIEDRQWFKLDRERVDV
jgi:hypothetical protein